MHQQRDFPSQNTLCFGPALGRLVRLFNILDLLRSQESEVLEEGVYIGVRCVQPELIEGVRRSLPGIQPHCARFSLAELLAVGLGHQRNGEAVILRSMQSAGQTDTTCEVRPMIVHADRADATMQLVELRNTLRIRNDVTEQVD